MSDKRITVKKVKAQPVQMEAEALIAQAIDKGVPVESLERLLAMRRELKAEHAKEEFDRAMASFQAECPTIIKTKEVKTAGGIIAYRYAPIESIVEQVREQLRKNGFSYSTNMKLLEDGVEVSLKVTHSLGHSETTEMTIPLGNKTNVMSQSQVVAAAQTFAKRYAFCNAFGILTGDEDTDAKPMQNASNSDKSEEKQPITHTIPPMSDSQRKFIFKLLEQKGKTKAELDGLCDAKWKKTFHDLNLDQASAVISKLNSFPDIRNQFEFSKKTYDPIPPKHDEADDIDLDEVDEGIRAMQK